MQESASAFAGVFLFMAQQLVEDGVLAVQGILCLREAAGVQPMRNVYSLGAGHT
jgi:hypothetical protein